MRSFSNINKDTELLEDLDALSLIQKVLHTTDLREYVVDRVLAKYRKRHLKSRWTVTIVKHFEEAISVSFLSEEEVEALEKKYFSIRYGAKIGICDDMRIHQIKDFKGRKFTVGEEVIPKMKIGAINLDRENKLSIRLDYIEEPGKITWRDMASLNKWI
jgi:hypothetical protein